jgi:hypothetical protein
MLTNIKRIKSKDFYPDSNWLQLNRYMRFIINCFFHHFVYPEGKSKIPHLLCYKGFAVDDYGFTLDAADMCHPRLSLI